jgi:hypothetical protein
MVFRVSRSGDTANGGIMGDIEEPVEARVIDIDTRTNEELREMLDELSAEEKEVSYRRRVLHGKIDILRAELVRRLKEQHESGQDAISGHDMDRLVRILANEYRPLMDAGDVEDKD